MLINFNNQFFLTSAMHILSIPSLVYCSMSKKLLINLKVYVKFKQEAQLFIHYAQYPY